MTRFPEFTHRELTLFFGAWSDMCCQLEVPHCYCVEVDLKWIKKTTFVSATLTAGKSAPKLKVIRGFSQKNLVEFYVRSNVYELPYNPEMTIVRRSLFCLGLRLTKKCDSFGMASSLLKEKFAVTFYFRNDFFVSFPEFLWCFEVFELRAHFLTFSNVFGCVRNSEFA
jgi:hypothetical protein